MSEPARELEVDRPVHRESWIGNVAPAFFRALRRGDTHQPDTVRTYSWALAKLWRFLQAEGIDDIQDVTRDHLHRWQDELMDTTLSPRSRQMASTAARALFRWLLEEGIVEDWRLERAIVAVRIKRKKKRPIPRADLDRIIAWLGPRREHMTIIELRDRAMFFYALVTAARLKELLQAMRRDFVAPIVIQKGGDEVTLNTSPSVLDMVLDYVRARRDDSPFLWVKHGNNITVAGQRLQPSGVREACKRIALNLQIHPFSPHRIRNTAASYLANQGISPAGIAAHLHHANLDTVYDYIEIEAPMLKQISDTMDNLIRPPVRPLPRATRRDWSDYVGR